jgi:hypothetical protein
MESWIQKYGTEILMIGLVFVVFLLIFGMPIQDQHLESLKPILSKILKNAGYHSIHNQLPIQLRKTKHRTYTVNKQIVYVVLEKPSGEKYNKDTLLFVILHEISHILSPDEHHTEKFYQIERRLHQSARQLGYIRRENLDKSYPCRH